MSDNKPGFFASKLLTYLILFFLGLFSFCNAPEDTSIVNPKDYDLHNKEVS